MRLLHKSRVSVCLCILGCVLFSGCKKHLYSNINNETEIEKVKVTFDDENGDLNTVTVNLLENTKTTVLYQKEVIKTTEDFEVDDSFCEFIKKTILSDSTSNTKASKKNSDDQKITWGVTITTNDDYYNFSGLYEYPSYWSELLEYIGVR